MRTHATARIAALLTSLLAGPLWSAGETPEEKVTARRDAPLIAVIIDDLGYQRVAGRRTVNLTGPVACAILPHTPHARYLAKAAHAAGKEVMLHLPLQPAEMTRSAGPGEIMLDTSREHLAQLLQANLDAVPHTVGINTHMGSLVTRHPGHMQWLMEEIRERGDLFFVDSYTTPGSVGYRMALERGIPTTHRNVFLDNVQDPDDVARAFARLKSRARTQGFAVGIGHPYAVTLDYLEQALPQLVDEGFRLVSIEQIIRRHARAQPPETTPRDGFVPPIPGVVPQAFVVPSLAGE